MLFVFFLRRIVTISLCAGAFLLGMKTERMIEPKPAAAPAAAECPEPADG